MSCIYAFQTNPTYIDFPGKMAGLMFTSGCPFLCGYCSNSSLLPFKQGKGIEEVHAYCRYLLKNWVKAVVITGGEPTMHKDLPEVLSCVREYGISIKLDTNGFYPDTLQECIPFLEYVAMDMKVPLSMYPSFTGIDGLPGIEGVKPIVSALSLLREAKVQYEIRTTVIPGIHTREVMLELGQDIQGIGDYYLQPFIPHPSLPCVLLRGTERTSLGYLQELQPLLQPYVRTVHIRGEDFVGIHM
jgi:pyruvate formate lyase activating enzyme